MKRSLVLSVIALLGATLLTACGGAQAAVRSAVEEAEKAAEASVTSRDFSQVEPWFATPAEGAIQTGLQQTRDPLRQFISQLSGSDEVQVHSFQIQNVTVHESGGQAAVTYRLHFSVVRSGLAAFSAVVTQTLAVVNTPRGWRIGGGDASQVEVITGQWPPL